MLEALTFTSFIQFLFFDGKLNIFIHNPHFSNSDQSELTTTSWTNQQPLSPSQPFSVNLSRRIPDRVVLRKHIHHNVSKLLTASLSNAALLLLLSVNMIWSEFSSVWQLQRGVWPRMCRLREGWKFSLGVCSSGASVSANECCVFKTSQLIKVGADCGVKVNCACSRASAAKHPPLPTLCCRL